jgi:hypothetical protein
LNRQSYSTAGNANRYEALRAVAYSRDKQKDNAILKWVKEKTLELLNAS